MGNYLRATGRLVLRPEYEKADLDSLTIDETIERMRRRIGQRDGCIKTCREVLPELFAHAISLGVTVDQQDELIKLLAA